MNEESIVKGIVNSLRSQGYFVATEVPNFYRSADIAVINNEEEVWVIECKLSKISKAIEQGKTHKLSADKVYIGTLFKKTKQLTKNKIKEAGLGLIYLMPDGSINIEINAHNDNKPFKPVKDKLKRRIWEII